MNMIKVLWADDEIDLLRPHIIFLKKRGYQVVPVRSGEEALARMDNETFDIVLLDEMMEGMDGLAVVEKIKDFDMRTPIIMITKSEEENLMEDAIGARIDDYLTKPVNPSQIVSAIKRILESRKIREKRIPERFARLAAQNRAALQTGMNHEEWARAYERLIMWDIEINDYQNPGLKQLLSDQKREFNLEFGKYVRDSYPRWIKGENPPVFSHEIVSRYVIPVLSQPDAKVALVVIDCFRLDHWIDIEPLLEDFFQIERDLYYSLLPTATPFSRNALFGGLLPDEIFRAYPDMEETSRDSGTGMNRYEAELFTKQLKRLGANLDRPPRFIKVMNAEDSERIVKKFPDVSKPGCMGIVFNFIDILSHFRSESAIIQEIAPDEAAFRSLTRSWFTHSSLFEILKMFSRAGVKVVMTSDHGSVFCHRSTLAVGDRTTSTNIRYKYGKDISCNPDEAVSVDKPEDYHLPSFGMGTNYIIALEDYYFVYQKEYHKYERLFQDSFQHGGISLEEMILPVSVLTPR